LRSSFLQTSHVLGGKVSTCDHGVITQGSIELLKNIQAVVFDFDGVMTNNQALEGFDGKPKWRSHYDGQGISLLRAIGIRVCFITNESGVSARAVTELVDRWNRLPSSRGVHDSHGWEHVELFTNHGGERKVYAAEQWLNKHNLSWEVCAVMGDDLVDVPMMRRAFFRAAPASAERVIKDMCHFVSNRVGGMGAVRDFANIILEMRRIDPTTLPPQ
jgi:3-deoxy-D-manno-octulosonate 8-phosphate phosphatase (KDO 8-P phosphatase)